MKDFFKQILCDKNGLSSSKRVAGLLIILVVLVMYIICNATSIPQQDYTSLIVTATILLGADNAKETITDSFKNFQRKEHKD